MAENCPEFSAKPWSKPAGVIRLKIKKRRTSEAEKSPRSVLKLHNGPLVQDDRVQSLKRKNPFSCSPRKKSNLPRDSKKYDNKLFKALDGVKTDLNHATMELKERSDKGEVFEAKHGTAEKSTCFGVDAKEKKGSPSFPLDWSLKTKVRFISSRSFNWYKTLTTSEESQGLSKFVRCETNNKEMELGLVDNYRSDFYKNTMVWMHPSLPWLNLFPRQSTEKKEPKSQHSPWPLGEQIVSSLQRDWITSFRSAFNILRSSYCAYFYLVANQCTVLFQAPEISGEKAIRVVMTPTTKGLRDSLRKEGINFTMPHLNSEYMDSNCESEPNTTQMEGHASDQESGDEEDWLQSVGLDKESFPELDSSSMSRANLRGIDQQPSSTVVVQGNDTQALFNFLLNCKSLVANIGPLTGVPPTLIAPVAFEGSILRTLKVNQGILKQHAAKGMKQVYSLEVTGPILPGCVYEMCQLIQTTQKGEFTASFSAHQLSVALNVPTNKDEEQHHRSHEFISECGVSPAQQSYYGKSQELPRSCIKELHCKDNLFKWKSS